MEVLRNMFGPAPAYQKQAIYISSSPDGGRQIGSSKAHSPSNWPLGVNRYEYPIQWLCPRGLSCVFNLFFLTFPLISICLYVEIRQPLRLNQTDNYHCAVLNLYMHAWSDIQFAVAKLLSFLSCECSSSSSSMHIEHVQCMKPFIPQLKAADYDFRRVINLSVEGNFTMYPN